MAITAIIPHLHFDGTAAEAIAHYRATLGAESGPPMTYAELPGHDVAPEHRSRVMHARLQVGAAALMVADRLPGDPAPASNGTVVIELSDPAELDRRFDALASGGRVEMAPHDAFWGARFGQLVDRFGVSWMLHAELKPGAR